MRGGSLGHVLVFAIAVRSVICLFVGDRCFARCVCLLAMFDGSCCCLSRIVMYALRLFGHVLVCAIAAFSVICIFVCVGCVAWFVCFVCHV